MLSNTTEAAEVTHAMPPTPFDDVVETTYINEHDGANDNDDDSNHQGCDAGVRPPSTLTSQTSVTTGAAGNRQPFSSTHNSVGDTNTSATAVEAVDSSGDRKLGSVVGHQTIEERQWAPVPRPSLNVVHSRELPGAYVNYHGHDRVPNDCLRLCQGNGPIMMRFLCQTGREGVWDAIGAVLVRESVNVADGGAMPNNDAGVSSVVAEAGSCV